MPIMMMMKLLRALLARNKTASYLLLILTLLFVSYGCFIGAIMLFENFNFWEADYVAWQTFTTVGYGDKPPETIWGRFSVRVFGTLGIFFMGIVLAVSAEMFYDNITRRRFGLKKTRIRNGYIVVNWSGIASFRILIETIRPKEPEAGIVIMDNKLECLPPEVLEYGNVEFVRGPTTDWENFERANIYSNDRVHIFPPDPLDPLSDSATSMTVRLIETKFPKISKIATYLIDKTNEWMFEARLPVTAVFYHNIAISFGVQDTQDPGAGTAFHDAVLNAGNIDIQSKIPMKCVGLSWRQLQAKVATLAVKHGVKIILFGLMGKDEIPNNFPPPKRKIRSSDRILMVVPYKFNWEEFETMLVK